jgi:hypothetical protein
MVDGKLAKQEEEKRREAGSPLLFQDALRLPNISLQQSMTQSVGSSNNGGFRSGYASPTNILNDSS